MKLLYLFSLSIFFKILFFSNYVFCASHSKEEWKSRSIYQILTDRFALTNDNDKIQCSALNVYCGGTFQGIKKHLDYIKGMGFDAIWISPPLKNRQDSFHGYHIIDINSINEHFGTAQDLKDLIKACHDKDIWVILDAVPNHMAWGLDISTFIPFNNDEYYHTYFTECNKKDELKYNSTLNENCSIYGLPDLKQENEYVNKTLIEWLKNTIKTYDFDGVRYADVPNVPKWFWGNFTVAANTYTLGIVGVDSADEDDVNFMVDYQNYMDGIGNYPLFYKIRENFCSDNSKKGSMIELNKFIQNLQTHFLEPQYMGIWLGNHDKERFLHQCPQNISLRNAITFTFFFEGIPIFYYGDEQYFNGPNENEGHREMLFGKYDTNSEIYKLLKIINDVRKSEKIYDYDFVRRYHDNNHYVFTRGNVLICVGNGVDTPSNIVLYRHGFKEGDKLCNALALDDCVKVVNNEIQILLQGEPKIYVKQTSANNGRSITQSSKGYFLKEYSLCLFLILLIFM